MNRSKFTNALSRLTAYIMDEDYIGYDPYDTLNSRIDFLYLGKWPAVAATQLQKRNPINIRKLIGIKKDHNPKAMGLFLAGFCLLEKNCGERSYKNEIEQIFDWLTNNYSKDYSGFCWGYNFPWISPGKQVDAYIPSVVVTAFVGKGIFEYYRMTRNPRAKAILESICEFILNDLPAFKDQSGICFSYTPLYKDCCYNAGMLGAEILAKVYSLTKDSKLLDPVQRSVDFVLTRQQKDGHWNYSLDIKTGTERKQIDFHQGFILESLFEIKKHMDISADLLSEALKKGTRYYKERQFFKNGRSLWRVPQKWPADIHHQAQGIITFTKLKSLDPEYFKWAEKIADWTINNMQDDNGYFYYQKWKFFKNKISYIRWGQAWMLLALANLLSCWEEKD